MSSGFNTDVRAGKRVFHVQTEDRGPSHPFIDTVVYEKGRILHRRSSNYEEFAGSAEFGAEALRERVEQQHRAVIEELRSGTIKVEFGAANPRENPAGGIQVKLLNPDSWLIGDNASLDIEVLRRADQQPLAGAGVEVTVEGALADARHAGASDERGRARIQFPLPPLGKGDLALVIVAKTEVGEDEIRFAMRSRPNPPRSTPVAGS